MPTSKLLRLAGLPLLLGGIIGAIVVAIHPRELIDPINGPVHLMLFFGALMVLLGWPAVLARQAGRIGILGPIGFVLVYFGQAFDLVHSVVELSVVPVLASDATTRRLLAGDSSASTALMHGPYGLLMVLTLPLLLFGLVTFGVATLRAGILPRWPSAIFLAAAATLPLTVLFQPLGPIGPALFYIGIASYGVVLVWPALALATIRGAAVAPGRAQG